MTGFNGISKDADEMIAKAQFIKSQAQKRRKTGVLDAAVWIRECADEISAMIQG